MENNDRMTKESLVLTPLEEVHDSWEKMINIVEGSLPSLPKYTSKIGPYDIILWKGNEYSIEKTMDGKKFFTSIRFYKGRLSSIATRFDDTVLWTFRPQGLSYRLYDGLEKKYPYKGEQLQERINQVIRNSEIEIFSAELVKNSQR